jgi:5-methylcytosine-specific restriction endonuclease McrA
MGKKLPNTPKSQIVHALRLLWLRSRERAAVIKRDGNCCQECGKKGSTAKGREVYIEVHHLNGISWDKMVEYIYRHLLVNPKDAVALCKECHHKITEEQKLPW